jgi:hypothetical protein
VRLGFIGQGPSTTGFRTFVVSQRDVCAYTLPGLPDLPPEELIPAGQLAVGVLVRVSTTRPLCAVSRTV